MIAEAKEKKAPAQTPLMKQYNAIKAVHSDAILLFRIGDFYEMFGEDAIRASGILGITLTRRANGAAAYIELAGFPHHSIDTYLPKLVRAGERVAICDQLEDPKLAKGIVKRGVTELITPGIALSDTILSPKGNTFLASVFFGREKTGVAFLDISTGEFYTAQGSDDYVDKLIANFSPKEIIYQRGYEERFSGAFGSKHYTYRLDEWVFSPQLNSEKLCKQFQVSSLKGYGIDQMPSAVAAAGAILYYLEFTEHNNTKHINGISRIEEDSYVWIDRFTIRNLELFGSTSLRNSGGFAGVIDRTLTPMGGRLLRRWIALPIKDVEQINARLDVVERFKDNSEFGESIGDQLSVVGDLERICSRVATQRAVPREIVQLKNAIVATTKIKTILTNSGDEKLVAQGDLLDTLDDLQLRIGREIYPDPTNQIARGGVIADGVDMELDDLRRISMRGKDVIAEIQEREAVATGISSLKISFNNVFGYYIEVRNLHKDKVPAGWIRKQTLTSAERYITPELKEYEEKILGAQEKILVIEQRIYDQLMAFVAQHISVIQRNAAVLARLDCLRSFAQIATERGYCRPKLDESKVLEIKQGRHPVIETLLPVGEAYIPNDIYLDDKKQQIIMITGPNMSGKSALLRQTALIVLMAQIGCYVPAAAARIGIVDKIFTRVGASDNISEGESTFMVEMLESANILNNLSDRSLILLDEIGRGTSTYDGISIAWAMVEYIHNHPTFHAKTLFATHYHELNEMENLCQRVKNYHVSVREVDRKVVFLRKLEPGGTEHSFGIHVAKMAGMPRWVVDRAQAKLLNMETTLRANEKEVIPKKSKNATDIQLTMFQLDDPVLIQIRDQIRGLDINELTPLEALNKLSEIKKITGI